MLAAKMNSGGFGETLDSMLDGFNAFLTRNTSEFIIVRISHTKQICSEVVTRFGRHPILQKLFRSTPVNLAEMPAARLRGKLVVVLGASDFCSTSIQVRVFTDSRNTKTVRQYRRVSQPAAVSQVDGALRRLKKPLLKVR